jgi:integrase
MGKLSARRVESIKKPGIYGDGDGLYLRVRSGGAKYWTLRTTLKGKRIELGLGPYYALSLAEAREKARQWRIMVYDGQDPRKSAQRREMTLAEASQKFFNSQKAEWSEGHASRWWEGLQRHVLAELGEIPVSEVTSTHLLELLGPMWSTKHETAKRALQRIGAVYDYLHGAGLYAGQNPTLGLRRALPKVRAKTENFASMEWEAVPAFFAALGDRPSLTSAALQFLILTACRSGEIRGARWQEIEGDVWTIPEERMKARREHVVPLTPAALGVLEAVRGHHDDLVFPSASRTGEVQPLSDAAFDRLLKNRMGVKGATPHGFRTSFRSWAADHGADREVAELCLAHRIGSEVEQAYQRSNLLNRRRALLERWAQHVEGKAPSKVVSLR